MTEREPTDVQPLGEAASAVIPWDEARKQLAEPDYYWLVTMRPDSRPHIRPLLSVWLVDFLYFCTGTTTRNGRNLIVDSHCSLATETDDFHFVVEGRARKVSDEGTLRDVADVYATKYGWQVAVRDGAFYAEGAPTAGPPPYEVYKLTTTTVFGFSLDESIAATRWRFG